MKKIVHILALAAAVALPGLWAGCGGGQQVTANTELQKPGQAVARIPEPGENRATKATVGRILNFLASDSLKGRDTGSDGIEKAALFIEDQFLVNGVRPWYTTFRDTLSNTDVTAYNLVGWVEGSDPNLKNEFIVIGAHYDHIGVISSVAGDSIANGANDNASGTATVLELARYFGQERSNKRSLIFALFSAEEDGLLGSAHLAARLKKEELPLYVMLNFEMTGVPLAHDEYTAYITGYEKSNLAAVCNRYAGDTLIGFLPTATEYNLFQRSDNYPFHQEFQVPSQTFCTFDFTNFDHYHAVGDEAGLLDTGHMSSLINKMIPVIEGIANSANREISYTDG